MMKLLFVTVVVPYASAAWSSGHVGMDRPGGELVDAPLKLQGAQACFDTCQSTARCESWVHEACPEESRCLLKTSVPQQQLPNTGTSCIVTSGVRHAAAEGLLPLLYKPLRLGQVQVGGWLREQLIVMANGLSGHLDLFWDDVMDSVWIGGTHDKSGAGHERGPYWLNGMVPLAAHLNATGDTGKLNVDINAQVNHWVSYILEHQLPNGWLGPDDGFGGAGNTYWTGWNTAAALLQYADAAGLESAMGQRCTKAVLRYVTEVHRRMLTVPTTAWTQNRWQDWVYIVHWLLDIAPQGQEQLLWDAAELTFEQSWDWDAYYAQTGVGTKGAYKGKKMPKFTEAPAGSWSMWDHGVNNAMGTKSCHTWYRQSRNASDLENGRYKLQMQERFHGQPYGVFSADECFGGRNLNRGIELCAVVEQMYSLQHMFKVEGDPSLLDKMERIAYNALPGTITADSWQHQYLQQANEINASYDTSPHVWQTDGVASTGFGVAPNFGCCTANMQQGWPKLASNIFLEAADGSLVVALLLPAKVTFKGAAVDMSANDYPFDDNVNITIEGDLKMQIRIPGWADRAMIAVNGADKVAVKNGTFHAVTCSGSTKLVVYLNPTIRVEAGWGSLGESASPVFYSAAGVQMPSKLPADFIFASGEVDESSGVLTGGASTTGSRKPGVTDLRSGNSGEITSATIAHAIESEGHYITSFDFSYQYITGYGASGAPGGANFTLELVDAQMATLHTIYSSPPLVDYPFSGFKSYSPAVTVKLTDLKINSRSAVRAIMRFQNNKRNIQIPLDTLNLTIGWSVELAPGPHDPPSNFTVPPTNAGAVLRGALLYALPLKEDISVVTVWKPFNNTDVDMKTSTPWNTALRLQTMDYTPRTPSRSLLPWETAGVRGAITVVGCSVADWKETCNAAAEPMPSPLADGACGQTKSVTLVPYGSTNLRMSAFPWTSGSDVLLV